MLFRSEIRSGAMLYTDIKMPEVLSDEGLLALKPGDRLVVIESRWEPGHLGLRPGTMSSFQPLMKLDQGGDQWMLLEKR